MGICNNARKFQLKARETPGNETSYQLKMIYVMMSLALLCNLCYIWLDPKIYCNTTNTGTSDEKVTKLESIGVSFGVYTTYFTMVLGQVTFFNALEAILMLRLELSVKSLVPDINERHQMTKNHINLKRRMFWLTFIFLTSDFVIFVAIIILDCKKEVFDKNSHYAQFTHAFLACLFIMLFFAFVSLCGAVAISCLTYRWFRLKYCDSKKL